MSQTDTLLRRVALSLRLREAVEDLQIGLAAGACVSLVGFGIRALDLIEPLPASWVLLAGAGTALAVPLVGALLRRRSRAQVAATADERLGLSERMSTAAWCQAVRGDDRAPLSHLVEKDADHVAGSISGSQLRLAFRPALLRRPVAIAAVATLAAVLVNFYEPVAEATESEDQKIARLADENRISEVMRKLKEAAKKAEEQAGERKQVKLQAAAKTLREEAERMLVDPPKRPTALKRLNKVADETRQVARKHAGMPSDAEPAEMSAQDKKLAEVLREMAKAGLESLQKDLQDLQDRLEKSKDGDSPAPSERELEAMAQRIDALKKAMEQASGESGAQRMMEQMQSLGNEDLMSEISEKLRDIAQKMSQGQDYQSMQSESGEGSEPMQLGQMSREELQELLDQLDELTAMEDLAQMMQGGNMEMSGGRRLKIGWGEP